MDESECRIIIVIIMTIAAISVQLRVCLLSSVFHGLLLVLRIQQLLHLQPVNVLMFAGLMTAMFCFILVAVWCGSDCYCC